MASLPKYESEIILSTATVVGTFGGFTVTMPAGNYFLNSVGYGGVTRSFCNELAFQMEASMGSGSSSVTVDDNSDTSTGAVEISRSSAFAVTWTSTAIRNLLGFSADLISSPTHTSTGTSAKYLWLPNCGRSGIQSPQASTGAVEADRTVARGTDGSAFVWSGSTRSRDTLIHMLVLGSKMWTSKEVIGNEAFETFYRLAMPYRIRFHADRAVDATYRTWVLGDDGNQMAPVPVREDWADGAKSLWSIRYSVFEV